MFCRFFCFFFNSLAKPFFVFFQFHSVISRNSKVHYSASFLFFVIITRYRLMTEIRWFVSMSKSQLSLFVSFSRKDSEMYTYLLFFWPNFNFWYNSQWNFVKWLKIKKEVSQLMNKRDKWSFINKKKRTKVYHIISYPSLSIYPSSNGPQISSSFITNIQLLCYHSFFIWISIPRLFVVLYCKLIFCVEFFMETCARDNSMVFSFLLLSFFLPLISTVSVTLQ